ncbi:hypothetical protein C8E95_4609 [Pseudonocardia autotrophica]|uniref:Uncharacterized protein n=2 Tax=Pseudonocardia TaxID=1847 RepID=A0A1Y2MK70_PSEAH|nr:hypothetical protein BG845_06489 [Pseudonocardia autotrophica]TDN75443.1 hypothetical protein C8E95_4609 [Pseudonocardia autotrophica]BBF99408.1 hypothetical protein Pdca_06180 [Pseudonocardia autotrophica]GEC29334.1 hypothetical protein PSA01_63630 [Pseudonocardia saturnea]
MNMGWADDPDEPDDVTDPAGDPYWRDERSVPRVVGCLLATAAGAGQIIRRSSAATLLTCWRALTLLRREEPELCTGSGGACSLAGPGNPTTYPPHGPLVSRRRRRRRRTHTRSGPVPRRSDSSAD